MKADLATSVRQISKELAKAFGPNIIKRVRNTACVFDQGSLPGHEIKGGSRIEPLL
jgi:hypothetical protein